MVVETTSEETNITERASGTGQLADAEDISGGKTARTSATESTTLYLSVAAAVDVTVEASPDGGSTWYTLPESPLKLDAPGADADTNDTAVKFGYDFDRLRLSASNGTAITAQLREVV